VNDLARRGGDALLRAPYAWLVSTFAVVFLLVPSLSGIARETGHGSVPLAIAAAGVALSQGAIAVLVAPRAVLARLAEEQSAGQAAMTEWVLALAPFLTTYGAVAAGAERWALSVGVLMTTILLVKAARSARRAGRA
jgi:hypothetical protein